MYNLCKGYGCCLNEFAPYNVLSDNAVRFIRIRFNGTLSTLSRTPAIFSAANIGYYLFSAKIIYFTDVFGFKQRCLPTLS